MEPRKTTTIDQRDEFREFADADFDSNRVEERLSSLLAANAEFSKSTSVFDSDRERLEADLMENPISTEKAFAYFGLLLGALPPAAFFGRFIFEADGLKGSDSWIIGLLLLTNITTSITGFFTGKVVGRAVLSLEKSPFWGMLFVMPFIGLLWGIVAGGAGGLFLFVIGAVFGAIIGGAVGAAALPVFAVFHRLLKSGTFMERDEFLPVAFGIALAISALILGVPT